jgi:hypothetical protein
MKLRPGDRTGTLVAVAPVASAAKSSKWLFRCDCGIEKEIRLSHIRTGSTRSCGRWCPAAGRSHGMSSTKLYGVWKAMRQRCANPNDRSFGYYGGRGISVAEEWQSFGAFRDWAQTAGYAPGLELDRIDNDGPYCPTNCRFAPHRENSRNRTNSLRMPSGELLSHAAERSGLNHRTVTSRRLRGWPAQKLLKPVVG